MHKFGLLTKLSDCIDPFVPTVPTCAVRETASLGQHMLELSCENATVGTNGLRDLSVGHCCCCNTFHTNNSCMGCVAATTVASCERVFKESKGHYTRDQ